MATLQLSGTTITVEFGARERTLVKRASLTVPLTAVRRVTRTGDPLREAHGARKGLQVSGFAKVGVWGVFSGPRQLVAAYRGRPGLRIELDRAATGDEFDELVLSVDDTAQTALIMRKLGADR